MKKILLLCSVFLLFLSCVSPNNCPAGINLLPLYGKVKKCSAQIESDRAFLKECDKNFSDRKKASRYYTERGWSYYYSKKPDTAMMRFNQAWLLDSLNADVFWGYGDLVGQQKNYKESVVFFDHSLRLNASNSKVWESAATSYVQLFFKTKDVSFLNKSTGFLKGAIKLDPKNPGLYAELTTAYSYFNQKDSACKYLKITDALDKHVVGAEVRKTIGGY